MIELPRVAQFQSQTSPKSEDQGRGTNLGLIDTALGQLMQHALPDKSDWDPLVQQHIIIKDLRALTAACAYWMLSKKHKTKGKTQGPHYRRWFQIRALLESGLDELELLDPAEGAFARRKTQAITGGGDTGLIKARTRNRLGAK